MKKCIWIFLLLIFSTTACSDKNEPGDMAPDADPENLPSIIGTFVINGIDPIGDEYGGHLTITTGSDPDSYHLQWIVVGGIQEGIGIVKGNQLLVEWQTIDGVEFATGKAAFTITEAGQLHGSRTADGMDGEGEEQAYPNQ